MSQRFSQTLLTELAAMRRYARSLARDDALADDIVQDALVRAIEREGTFRPGASVRSWLLAIVHNVYVSGMRKLSAEASRNARFAETLVESVEPEQEQAALLTQTAQAFAALPDHQRQVLHLVAIEDLSYQEASEVLQIPIGTVMSRLSRARTALRFAGDERAGERRRLKIVGGEDGD